LSKLNLILIHVKKWGITFCLGCLLLGCNTENGVEKTVFREHSVKNIEVFLTVEDTPFLGRPTAIKAVAEGLFIVDEGHYQIIKVDKEGDRLLSFGSHGQGPGELQSIAGFWAFENEYLVYDYNSFKFLTFDHRGELIDEKVLNENPVNPDSEFSIPITLDALSSDKLIIPTGGRKGSLFAITDRISGDVTYSGIAVGEFIQEYNSQKVMQTYSSGEIPDIAINLVMLSNSSNGIYSFQQTTGVLEKYTHAGEQIWEKHLKIPAQRNLFEKIAQYNKESGSDNVRRMFIYARAMDALEDGVALLLNLPDDQSLNVVWVPEDGSKIDLVRVEGITLEADGFMEGFTVSPDGQYTYYLERNTGTIYKFKWPL
jgi:hypothetical protein